MVIIVVTPVPSMLGCMAPTVCPQVLGTCANFNERQVGSERYNLFTGCPNARTATIILRGGADQFIEEAERSLHDAIMIVRRAIKNAAVVPGGGAIDVSGLQWRVFWVATEAAGGLRQKDAGP